ncbi:LysM peptidoglycan-binding domain-containing protein [Bacillus megaterium]|nr:LysM peptidoglycan-binding domain-containing protein [Priestia megaterium]
MFNYSKAFKDVLSDLEPPAKQHILVSGLYAIQEYITVDDLITANPDVKPSELKIGRR